MRCSASNGLVISIGALLLFNVYYTTEKPVTKESHPRSDDSMEELNLDNYQEMNLNDPNQEYELNLNDPESLLTPEPARVYCMVPFLWNKSSVTGGYVEGTLRGRHEEIMRTWGYRCDHIRFFIDPLDNKTEAALLPSNVIELHMRRRYGSTLCGPKENLKPCKHIWEKVWRMWVWVAEHEAHLAEWFVKLDDDSFLFPENLKRYVRLSGMKASDSHYFGNEARHRHVPLILGACVVFSRELIQISASVWKQMPYQDSFQTDTCADVNGMTEELTTAVCLNSKLKVRSTGAVWHGREMVLSFQPTYHLWQLRNDAWYWENRPASTGDGPNCCSGYPIAFHNMKDAGAHDTQYKELFGFIENNTRVAGKKMYPEYIERVATNLGLVRQSLRVSNGCGTDLTRALALARTLFAERTLVVVKLHCNRGASFESARHQIDVLVVIGQSNVKQSINEATVESAAPHLVIMMASDTESVSATEIGMMMKGGVDMVISGDTVQANHKHLVWTAEDREAAFTTTYENVNAKGTMHNLILAGRRIRNQLIENGTYAELIGDEVYYD